MTVGHFTYNFSRKDGMYEHREIFPGHTHSKFTQRSPKSVDTTARVRETNDIVANH